MPYIKQKDRTKFTKSLESLPAFTTAGDLNYILTKICKSYANDNGESYRTYNDIIGALECCKIEFYRRTISPYEGIKIAENGDV